MFQTHSLYSVGKPLKVADAHVDTKFRDEARGGEQGEKQDPPTTLRAREVQGTPIAGGADHEYSPRSPREVEEAPLRTKGSPTLQSKEQKKEDPGCCCAIS